MLQWNASASNFPCNNKKINQTILGFSAIKDIAKSHKDPEFIFELFGERFFWFYFDIQLPKNNILIRQV